MIFNSWECRIQSPCNFFIAFPKDSIKDRTSRWTGTRAKLFEVPEEFRHPVKHQTESMSRR